MGRSDFSTTSGGASSSNSNVFDRYAIDDEARCSNNRSQPQYRAEEELSETVGSEQTDSDCDEVAFQLYNVFDKHTHQEDAVAATAGKRSEWQTSWFSSKAEIAYQFEFLKSFAPRFDARRQQRQQQLRDNSSDHTPKTGNDGRARRATTEAFEPEPILETYDMFDSQAMNNMMMMTMPRGGYSMERETGLNAVINRHQFDQQQQQQQPNQSGQHHNTSDTSRQGYETDQDYEMYAVKAEIENQFEQLRRHSNTKPSYEEPNTNQESLYADKEQIEQQFEQIRRLSNSTKPASATTSYETNHHHHHEHQQAALHTTTGSKSEMDQQHHHNQQQQQQQQQLEQVRLHSNTRIGGFETRHDKGLYADKTDIDYQLEQMRRRTTIKKDYETYHGQSLYANKKEIEGQLNQLERRTPSSKEAGNATHRRQHEDGQGSVYSAKTDIDRQLEHMRRSSNSNNEEYDETHHYHDYEQGLYADKTEIDRQLSQLRRHPNSNQDYDTYQEQGLYVDKSEIDQQFQHIRRLSNNSGRTDSHTDPGQQRLYPKQPNVDMASEQPKRPFDTRSGNHHVVLSPTKAKRDGQNQKSRQIPVLRTERSTEGKDGLLTDNKTMRSKPSNKTPGSKPADVDSWRKPPLSRPPTTTTTTTTALEPRQPFHFPNDDSNEPSYNVKEEIDHQFHQLRARAANVIGNYHRGPISPRGAVPPISPRGAVPPISPRGIRPNSPRGITPSSPRVSSSSPRLSSSSPRVSSSSPRGVPANSPRGVPANSPRGKPLSSPRDIVFNAPRAVSPRSPANAAFEKRHPSPVQRHPSPAHHDLVVSPRTDDDRCLRDTKAEIANQFDQLRSRAAGANLPHGSRPFQLFNAFDGLDADVDGSNPIKSEIENEFEQLRSRARRSQSGPKAEIENEFEQLRSRARRAQAGGSNAQQQPIKNEIENQFEQLRSRAARAAQNGPRAANPVRLRRPTRPGAVFVPWGGRGPPPTTLNSMSRLPVREETPPTSEIEPQESADQDPEVAPDTSSTTTPQEIADAVDDPPTAPVTVSHEIIIVTPEEDWAPKGRTYKCWAVPLLVLLLIGAIAAGIGIVASRRNSGDSTGIPATQMDLPTVSCSTGMTLLQPNVVTQCICGGNITIIADDVAASYQKLRSSGFITELFQEFNATLESCVPSNQALVWLASATGTPSKDAKIRQRYALALLYILWNGQAWTNSKGWLSSKDECTWAGVACNSNSEVATIALSNNNLRGTLGMGVYLLTSLSGLSLGNNELAGSLSPGFAKLTALKELSIASNSLTGSIPSEFGQMSQLATIALDYNSLVGTLPADLGLLSGLLSLTMAYNELHGTMPTELGRLRNLRSLSFAANGLTGTIPTEIGLWSSAQAINLGQNQFHGSTLPSEVGLLSTLTNFVVTSAGLHGSLPHELFNVVSLQDFECQNNFLSGTFPTEIGQLSAMTFWRISNNKLTGTIPTEVGHLTRLSEMLLGGNSFHGTIPTELGLRSLDVLELMGNTFTGAVPDDVCNALRPLYCVSVDDSSSLQCHCCQCG